VKLASALQARIRGGVVRIRAGLGFWPFLFAVCVAAITVIDATLLELSASYFSSGYNSAYVGGVALRIGYFAASALLDAALVLGVWALLLPVLSAMRFSWLQRYLLAGACACAIPMSLNVVRHNLYAALGQRMSLSLLTQTSEGDAGALVQEFFGGASLGGIAVVSGLGVIAMVALLWLARNIEGRFPQAETSFTPPRSVGLAVSSVALFVLGTLILAISASGSASLHFGLTKKPAATLLTRVIQWGSDVDRDGFGFFSEPRDPDAFDASIRPFAIDEPGNAIDENGVGGDHPLDFAPVAVVEAPLAQGGRRPNFLLVFLESFRADLIEARLGSREITPTLNRIAREGSLSQRAFVHSPFTIASRAQLFSGRYVSRPGQTTLIDDFKQRGYFVAHFSGQDETYGDSEALLGVDRADVFYDARQDLALRTSDSVSPASLQISWKTLLDRVESFLDGHDSDAPLFLYVNIVDTHHPYDHDQLDPLLVEERIPRREIGPDRRDWLWATYANNAANVDHAIGRLLEAWNAHLAGRDSALLITADHGQAFYEQGLLGHGQSLDEKQTRVPFILRGIGGEWPEPLGHADVRGLLRRNLPLEVAGVPPRARFVPDPERSILQFVPYIDEPRWVGLRSLKRLAAFNLRFERLILIDENDDPLPIPEGEADSLQDEIIWNWEAVHRNSQ
jgi:phosphoglycerol transferase MdoB-like AlkP superfamily enzyme